MTLKILQIVGNSAFGGATYLILAWCKFLVEQGCRVDVLATDERTVTELESISGVKVIQYIHIPREISLICDLRTFTKILSLLNRENYDVVHTYSATPSFLGRLAARITDVPVILHHQAAWTVSEYSSRTERLVYTILEYSATLASTKGICVSHAIADQARLFHIAPQNKLVTICNGIDAQPFLERANTRYRQETRHRFDIPDGYLVIGNTSRLSFQKNNETLIRALIPLKLLLPGRSIILLLAGDGPEKQNLEALVLSLGLEKQVRFLGFLRDIPDFLSVLDIFISPSVREGLSISLLEAMAAAKPIVASSIPPNAELIEHEVSGLLVNPHSSEQIARAVARFVIDPNLAQKCASFAQQKALRDYTLDRMFKETWCLYNDLYQEAIA